MATHIFLLPFLLISAYIGEAISTPTPTRFDLFESSLRETLTQAQNAHELIANMDLSSFDERARTAWEDCRYLYQDTIDHLNRSISSKHDQLDVQTWLSAAIANEQTCQDGFLDFGLPSLTSQSPSLDQANANLSKLISDALIISKAVSVSSSSTTKQNKNRRLLAHGFPHWVSPDDRRLLQAIEKPKNGNIVVAQDGSAKYKTIAEGLAAAVAASATVGGDERISVYIKEGIYKEILVVEKTMKNLMLIGAGIDKTIITGSNSVQSGFSTFKSATFSVFGPGFIARGITFENTAGPEGNQAVALLSTGDNSVFYKCSFKGYQDTLYVHSNRQFYRECDIYGTIDFIFGDAVVVVQKSNIYLRNPLPKQKNAVTAQGRTNPNTNSGIVIHASRIAAAAGESPPENYLGRPWKLYSRTVFIACDIGGLIAPAGWLEWEGEFALNTLFYGEFGNSGGGAATAGRVKWPGFHVLASKAEAAEFSVGKFLAGESWIPVTSVPFYADI